MSASSAFRRLFLTVAVLAVFGAGCSGKKSKEEESSVPNAAMADENSAGDSDNGKAMGLQTVHFPYDSSVLDSEGKSTLKANAGVMKDHGSVKIQIEGHCDRHGGIQYNIALGEKRANSAKKFLADQGVNAERVSTVSFGKEKPVDPAETEEADAKNRRANFVITSK
jgi:peptidoglycan-associated lipoprotein